MEETEKETNKKSEEEKERKGKSAERDKHTHTHTHTHTDTERERKKGSEGVRLQSKAQDRHVEEEAKGAKTVLTFACSCQKLKKRKRVEEERIRLRGMTQVIVPVPVRPATSPKDKTIASRQMGYEYPAPVPGPETETDATLPQFILKTLDNRRKRAQPKDKPDRYLKRYSTTPSANATTTTSSSRFVSYRRLSQAPPLAELSKSTGDDAQCLLLHYPKSTRAKKEAIANKIEDVKKAGFAGPASVSRKNFHSSMEYKPELLADKARLLKTVIEKELQLSSGRSGIYKSMKNVSHMVKVSKKLSEDILSMDRAMRLRLHAMLHDRREDDHKDKKEGEGEGEENVMGNLPLDTMEMEIISRMMAPTDSENSESESEMSPPTLSSPSPSASVSTSHLESLLATTCTHEKKDEEKEENTRRGNKAGENMSLNQNKTQAVLDEAQAQAQVEGLLAKQQKESSSIRRSNTPSSSSASRSNLTERRSHNQNQNYTTNTRVLQGSNSVFSQNPSHSALALNRLKSTETKGSGFRKKRSYPQPRWIDHARLLQRAQLIADFEWNAYLSKKGTQLKP